MQGWIQNICLKRGWSAIIWFLKHILNPVKPLKIRHCSGNVQVMHMVKWYNV
jgi:hypothetical protein